MKNLFSALAAPRRLVLALALTLGTAGLAQAQTIVYALGTVTQGFSFGGITYPTGSQTLTALNPVTGDYATGAQASPSIGYLITNRPTNQKIVGIDYRTSNGDLYALGFDENAAAPTPNVQLYTLRVNTATTALLTPVGTAIRLEIADNNRNNTRGVIPNISFDFNPRVDRIRVVAPNGANYRLNPNTGGLAATDLNLFYAPGAVPPPTTSASAPYIGTAAYTNSRLGLRGTTLYDIDVAALNSVLSTQNPPNNGQLNPVANVQFFLPDASAGNQGPYDLTSPTVALGLDIYNQTTAYLIEARLRDNGQAVTPTTTYTTNFYTFNLSTGLATRLKNVIGNVTLFYSDLAAPILLPKAWIGQGGDNLWSNANNWFPVGVPSSADDVVINGTGTFIAAANATVGAQPVVTGAQQAASVTLNNNALLTTNNGATLTLSGDFVNNDSQVAGTGTGVIVLAGAAALDISGNAVTNFWNLGIGANGATTSSGVGIRRSVAVSGTLAIGTGQVFTLLSSASGTAYVDNTGGGTVSGLATAQRYITPTNPNLGYRHYGSPVTRNAAAATSNQINDLTVTGVFTPTVNAAYNSAPNPRQVRPYPTVFYYDQARLATSNASYAVGDFDNGFLSPAALTTEFDPARGYTVNLPATALVDFQGTLNQNASYARTGLARGAQAAAGYHLLGNPYPGALNYDLVIGNAGTTGMESALYVYKSSGPYTGTYTTYVPGNVGNNGGPVATNGGTSNLPLAQGFFMRTAAGQTGTVTIPTGARTNQPETALFQRTASTLPLLALTIGNGSIANQTAIYFDPTATPAFDAARDAHYLPATHGLDLASDLGPEALAINGLPEPTGTAVTVPLRLHAPAAGPYTLTVDELANLPAGYSAYLRDGLRNTVTNLAITASLSLTLDPADAATGRFTVIFATSQPLANAPATLAALVSLYPNPAHGTATLVLPQALRGQAASQVEVLNALGQVVLRRPVLATSPEAVELTLSGLAAGLYTVRATTANGAVARQLQVE